MLRKVRKQLVYVRSVVASLGVAPCLDLRSSNSRTNARKSVFCIGSLPALLESNLLARTFNREKSVRLLWANGLTLPPLAWHERQQHFGSTRKGTQSSGEKYLVSRVI